MGVFFFITRLKEKPRTLPVKAYLRRDNLSLSALVTELVFSLSTSFTPAFSSTFFTANNVLEMAPEQIEKYIEQRKNNGAMLTIHFKDRQTVTGMFVQMADYSELKSKNLWRVVRQSSLDEWKQTKNPNLNRIFNGMSFTRLSDDK